ncbi:YdeI/OmpD-associated family protein [Robertkochia marina]|uniref:YdeI/OmpD-associated family protein n=1 Tax=Robertkochia marina TaxID=1227945 RepID=UPI0018EFEC04|nr:YdeI/OmpD-associated family protein [Robertkochia marina]
MKSILSGGLRYILLTAETWWGLSAFKHHFGIWFFEGATLKDTRGVLQNAQKGKTKYMRQWKFTDVGQIDLALVEEYLEETLKWAETNPAPTKNKVTANSSLQVPPLLKEALTSDDELKNAFEGFTPFKQKEFAEYIDEAKRDATKQKRLNKIRDMILKGEGLNDRYR